MSHPSVFELAAFIAHGELSASAQAHVSACDSCAERLSGLAQRSLIARGVTARVPSRAVSPVLGMLVAFGSCAALVLALASTSASAQRRSFSHSPEGVHGVAVPSEPARLTLSLPLDAGPSGPID